MNAHIRDDWFEIQRGLQSSERLKGRLVAAAEMTSAPKKASRLKSNTRWNDTAADLSGIIPAASFLEISRAGLMEPGILRGAMEAGWLGRTGIDISETEPSTAPFADINYQVNASAVGNKIDMINSVARWERS